MLLEVCVLFLIIQLSEGEKREQLKTIKDLEKNKKDIEDNPHLDDVVRGIRIDHAQELLDQAIRKYNGV